MVRKRILVVDDELITLKLTKKLLTSHNYEVDISTNSSDAVKKLGKENYDIVIVDVSMPSISGFDLLQMMQGLDMNMPVIFLSNNENDWTIEQSYSMGAKRFVSKEKEFNYLPQIIAEVLDEV